MTDIAIKLVEQPILDSLLDKIQKCQSQANESNKPFWQGYYNFLNTILLMNINAPEDKADYMKKAVTKLCVSLDTLLDLHDEYYNAVFCTVVDIVLQEIESIIQFPESLTILA